MYAGYNLSEKSTPYILADYIDIDDNDIHVYPLEKLKVAVGYRYNFSYLLNLKVQLEQTWEFEHFGHNDHDGALGGPFLRVQLAYGF